AGKELHKLKCQDVNSPFSLSFSPDSKVLASKGSTTLQMWDVTTGQELRRQVAHTCEVRAVCFSPDGRTLATAAASAVGNDAVRIWDAHLGRPLRRMEHPGGAHAVVISPDGKILASGGAGLVCVWDAATGKPLRKLKSPGGSPLGFSPDGKILI